MRLRDNEAKALQQAKAGQLICVWRVAEPRWREGKRYTDETVGEVTVLSVHLVDVTKIKLKDVKRSGWKYEKLMEQLRKDGLGARVWESRMVRGDTTGRPRLMQPSGRRSGDYTDQPALAMRDEPEAITADQHEEIQSRNAKEREERVRAWREKTEAEATELFRGEDALRNFTRVIKSLGQG